MTPNYWWDFDHDTDKIIIQSDLKNGDSICLAESDSIEEAESLIADLKSGRVTHKQLKERNK